MNPLLRYILLVFVLSSAATGYAQLPAQYVGKWQINQPYTGFAEYKTQFIYRMQTNAEHWKIPLKDYAKDSTAFINKLHANYDSTAKHTLTLTADSLYEFRFYDNVYNVWRINAEVYQYDNTKQEISLTNSCGSHAQKFKLISSPEQPAMLTLEEVYTGVYAIGYDCFPASPTMVKVE